MSSYSTVSLMERYAETVGVDWEAWAELFADDAVFEAPYLSSIGWEAGHDGREAIVASVKGFAETADGFRITNLKVLEAEDPLTVFATYEIHCTIRATGRPYDQSYFGWAQADESRKIKRFVEYLDPVQVVRAVLPGGFCRSEGLSNRAAGGRVLGCLVWPHGADIQRIPRRLWH